FWKFARDAKFARWQQEARSAAWRNLQWSWDELGISDDARQVAERLGFVPSEVFAHPEVLRKSPDLQKYYRLLACLPAKGLARFALKENEVIACSTSASSSIGFFPGCLYKPPGS